MLKTYQAKLKEMQLVNGNFMHRYFEEFGKFFGVLERRLFVDMFIHKKSQTDCKRQYQAKYGITARQFNSLVFQLKGKVDSVLEGQKNHIEMLQGKIGAVEKSISKKEEQKEKLHRKLMELKPQDTSFKEVHKKYRNAKFFIHQKKRKLRNLRTKLDALLLDDQMKVIRIFFGSKKLFHKQFHLKENGFSTHKEWLQEWQLKRSSQFVVLGSKDETFGNQSCTYDLNNNLRIRVANRFEETFNKYIDIPSVEFNYGQEDLDKAKIAYSGTTKGGKPAKYFRAITYRFVKKEHGWYLFATVEKDEPIIETSYLGGLIGIDLNAGFLSVGEIDRFGNPLAEVTKRILMYNRSSEQMEAELSDALEYIVQEAKTKGKSIAYENLNFSQKKKSLGEENAKYARMLSGFSYAKFKDLLEAKATKYGVGLIKINPFATSLVGQFKFMARYGLSSHGSAACVIARRGMRLKLEQPKYDTVLKLPKKFNKEKKNYSNWLSIAKSIKSNYIFNDRIELLKADI